MRRGFTLIEILVVMAILTAAVALVAPASIRSLDRFDRYLEENRVRFNETKVFFYEFAKDSECRLEDGEVVCE
ncbi:type II secretion system protein [Limisalsivibrio acetivorans]|uniref:type II secretion system protein n=1 Tax=Limisalsivibrio acetivorans TaxID=1304888 RepID=UPI0003B5D57E|nr:type II secretion system protein [Limisalsivibrio acetivorans]